jgi:DNA-directed RNA polymerase specialized sigma24 family protein
MKQNSKPPKAGSQRAQGRKNYKSGHAFEDRVAEAYRLLGYSVEHGRLFGGRQVDLYLELKLGDLQVRRAIECKVGLVTADHLDKFLIKLQLVRREYPDAQGTIVCANSFTDGVSAHATAVGIHLTLYRDLSAQILDAPSYAQAVIREVEVNDRYCPDVFVEPVIGYNSSDPGKNAFDFLNQWLEDGHWNQLTLLGDVGTGKSFLSRMLALRLANEYLRRPTEAPLPLLVDLRNADREFSLEGLILTHFAKYGLTRATFEIFQFLLSEGRIVLILDGFDEMASRVTPQITTRNFHELARCVKRNAKVLLTCRTHYFKSRTEEEEVVLGGTGPQSSDVARDLYWDLISRSGFKIAYLRPFTISQVEEYVRKARPQNATTILAKIRNIYNLSELSQRPLLLEMIVKSIDRLTETEVNPAHLYEVFTGAWIHRDRWRDLLRPEDKLKFLTALARSLWEQEKTSIDYRMLEAYVSAELASLIDSPQKLVELDGEIRTASFLVRNDQGQYGFAHSSYAEYFLAKDLANHIAVGNVRVFSIRRLTNEVIDFLLWMVDRNALEEMLSVVLLQGYQSLLSENALVVLYRLRRSLLVEEKGRGSAGTSLRVEMPTGAKLQGAKLAQINLEGAILRETRLDGADLAQCIAIDVDLTNASMREVSICKGDLQGACLKNVDATGAILTEVNFHGADVAGCDFSRADLSSSIFTVKDYTGAVFKDSIVGSAILPANSEATILGREPKTPIESLGWDKERTLKLVFEHARRYASAQGAVSDSEDIASDVVVYLLSNPSEMIRLKELGSKVGEISRTLVWRRLSTLRQEQSARLEPTSPERRRMPAAEDDNQDLSVPQSAIERYSFDLNASNEFLIVDQESNESEIDSDGYDIDTVDESQLSWEDAFSVWHEPGHPPLEADDLLKVLGKSLSQETLQLLIARYVEEESVDQIAKKLGISDVQVVRRLNMARELARRALRPS